MSEPLFFVRRPCLFKGKYRTEGSTLIVDEDIIKQEISLGTHPETKRPMSGLLNHCIPFNDAAKALVNGVPGVRTEIEEPKIDEKAEVEKLRKEFDALGKAYFRGWSYARLKKELIKVKKETGN